MKLIAFRCRHHWSLTAVPVKTRRRSMTALLEKAIAKTQVLPTAEQDRLATLLLQKIEAVESEREGAVARPIRDEILEIVEAELKGVWEDGAAEHDHYLYGTPRRSLREAPSLTRSIGSPLLTREAARMRR